MKLLFLIALAQAATPSPRLLTEIESRDIGCVAILGLLADEQRRGAGDASFPDVTSNGKTYAGIVGARIMADSGWPRELVAQAILTAAADTRTQSDASLEGKANVRGRAQQCVTLMQAELAAADPTLPLPKPTKAK